MRQVTLELNDKAYQQASEIARRTGKQVEDVLQEWLNQLAEEVPAALLTDEQVLALADMMMPEIQQAEMSNLLEKQRESQLTTSEQERLGGLLASYRKGLVRKSQAMKEAVERGLRPAALNELNEMCLL